jgi:hypothetical protein
MSPRSARRRRRSRPLWNREGAQHAHGVQPVHHGFRKRFLRGHDFGEGPEPESLGSTCPDQFAARRIGVAGRPAVVFLPESVSWRLRVRSGDGAQGVQHLYWAHPVPVRLPPGNPLKQGRCSTCSWCSTCSSGSVATDGGGSPSGWPDRIAVFSMLAASRMLDVGSTRRSRCRSSRSWFDSAMMLKAFNIGIGAHPVPVRLPSENPLKQGRCSTCSWCSTCSSESVATDGGGSPSGWLDRIAASSMLAASCMLVVRLTRRSPCRLSRSRFDSAMMLKAFNIGIGVHPLPVRLPPGNPLKQGRCSTCSRNGTSARNRSGVSSPVAVYSAAGRLSEGSVLIKRITARHFRRIHPLTCVSNELGTAGFTSP